MAKSKPSPEQRLSPSEELTLHEALALAALYRVSIWYESRVLIVHDPAPDIIREALHRHDEELRDLLRPALDKWRESRQRELLEMSYADYLVTPEWIAIRDQALTEADHRCRVCNSSEKLHVHHRSYAAMRGKETSNDLTVLCADCHALFHENGRVR